MNSPPEKSEKQRRNDICNCGSGKKFKKCHGSDSPTSLSPGQLDAQKKKLLPKEKCFAPPGMTAHCSRGTIAAHTISRSGSLGRIERKGHVYSFKVSQQSLFKANGRMTPQLTGWKAASTFPGFCSVHDKQIFSPLEDRPFTGSKEQCFLLAYRPIARELYAKIASKAQNDLRTTLALPDPAMNAQMRQYNAQVNLGVRDTTATKARYDKILENSDWSRVKGVLFEFDNIFPIQCAGAFFPKHDVNGVSIQKIDDKTSNPDTICAISFAADMKSYFCLLWLDEDSKSCEPFATALRKIPANEFTPILASFLLKNFENCHISPDWYDDLSTEGKSWCCRLMEPFHQLGEKIRYPAYYAKIPYFSGINVICIRDI